MSASHHTAQTVQGQTGSSAKPPRPQAWPPPNNVKATAAVLVIAGLWIVATKDKSPDICGRGWGLTRKDIREINRLLTANPGAGLGICLGPGRGPGGTWLIDLEIDGPEGENSLLCLLGGDILTMSWVSRRGRHRLFLVCGPRLLELLTAAGAKEGKGITAGVFKLPEFPGLEFRIGGFKEDGTTPKQLQSVVPPTQGTDGKAREWTGGPAIAELPEAAYANLEALADAKIAQAVEQAPTSTSAELGFDIPVGGVSSEEKLVRYLAKMNPAISGQAGHNATIRAAAMCCRFGFDEPERVFRFLSDHYNGRCHPPWSEKELRHKAEEACKTEKRRDKVTAPRFDAKPSSNGTGHQAAKIEVNEAPDDPHRLGRIFLKKRCEHQGKRTLVYHQGEFHLWEQSAYRPVPEHEINRSLNVVSKAEFDRLNRIAIDKWELAGGKDDKGKSTDKPIARKVSTRLIGDINQAIGGMTLLSGRVEPPHWLIDNPPFPAADVLPTANALVHLPSFVESKAGATCEPTPAFYCPYSLDYAFDPQAPIPQAWIDFLVSVWPKDAESIDTLQEWMGYLLTLDTRQQKIAMLIGPPRSGRGTISRVISGLVGPANVSNPTFAGLATQFGAACLIGKPVAIIGDARQSHRSDWAIALERLLMISGEDAMTIDRKNRPDWQGRLPTRLMLISNELPKFNDQSGALAARLLLFRFEESFVGREDKTLDARLKAELPGILLWAIRGWKRLRDRGHFLQPKGGRDLIDQFRDMASPVGAYVRERAKTGAGFRVKVDELFEDWKNWCTSKNREPGEQSVFGRNLRTVVPGLETKQMRVKGTKDRVRIFEGIKVKKGPPF